jgi:hypothetical protein
MKIHYCKKNNKNTKHFLWVPQLFANFCFLQGVLENNTAKSEDWLYI